MYRQSGRRVKSLLLKRDVAVTIIEVADPIFGEEDLFLNQDKLDIIDPNSKADVINVQEPLFKGTKNFKMLGTYIDPERDIINRSRLRLRKNIQTMVPTTSGYSQNKTLDIQCMHPPNPLLKPSYRWPHAIPS